MLPVPGAPWKAPRMIWYGDLWLNQWVICLLDYPSTKCNSNPLPEPDKLGVDSSSCCMSWKPRFCLSSVQERGTKGPFGFQGLEPLTIAFLSISSIQPGEWNYKHSSETLSVNADLTETGTVTTGAVLVWQQESKHRELWRSTIPRVTLQSGWQRSVGFWQRCGFVLPPK